MKSFNVPLNYRSSFISGIKQRRKEADKQKKDFLPTEIPIGRLIVLLARHFGFCYGVENAIEIAFTAVANNPGKRIFLLSEMIHNPHVNADLQALGVQFIMDNAGNNLISWDSITHDDIVIIPAFGTTLAIEAILREKGINPTQYETTCPFVEKVWNRAAKLGQAGYTIVVHGKPEHEETRATFSHSDSITPTVVVKDMAQTTLLGSYINGELPYSQFYADFKGQHSQNFDPKQHLQRIGVVNQTTMLASETQAIANYLKDVLQNKYGNEGSLLTDFFADTRDTLCYATNDNQQAVAALLAHEADFAVVVGGYNSSNTTHLVELCELKLPTYFIDKEECIALNGTVAHFNIHTHQLTHSALPITAGKPLRILLTSGASCPDALVERVIQRLATVCGEVF